MAKVEFSKPLQARITLLRKGVGAGAFSSPMRSPTNMHST